MTAFKHLLSQAHRRCCFARTIQSHLTFLHHHCRPFSSSEPEPSPPDPNQSDLNSNPRTPIPLKPVSYAVKETIEESPPPPPPPPAAARLPAAEYSPRDPNFSSRPSSQQSFTRPELENQNEIRTWTKEDFRYVKDAPTISPVSYPSRVAPLPEDRGATSEGLNQDHEMNEEKRENQELARERSRIEAGNLDFMRRVVRVEDEKVPFPTLIRPTNDKKEKDIYDLKEAIQLVKANARCNFEETFEAHVKLTPELRRTDLKLNGSVLLPHGSGKKYRVAVFAEGDAADEAREAGAAHVGGLDFIEQIKNSKKFDFDKCFATHQMMKHVLKIARYLKRGLMPNPDNGTVTNDISRAVKEAVSQTILFQKDKTAIVHVPLGKVKYTEDALRENIGAFMNGLLLAKPAGLKKSSKYAGYVSTFHVCSSMGPSFPVTMQSISMAVDRYNRLRLQV